jgi:hypothetical protein
MFLEELARNRVRSRMGKYFDEAAIMGAAE